VKKDVTFGVSSTGTYDPMAAAVFPAEVNVEDAETAYGPTGAEYAGTLDLSLYTLTSGIVWPDPDNVTEDEAAWGPTGAEYAGLYHESTVGEVKNGTMFGASSVLEGEYSPGGTFAEGQADQYSTDQAEVTAKAAYLDDTQTICEIAGTLDMDLWELVTTGDSRVATQLQDDKDAVTAGKADILTTRTILTIQGTYSPDFPDVGNVLTTDTTNGSSGTYVAPVAAGYSALAPGFGAGGGTSGTLAAAKIFDGTYGTLAAASILVAAGGSYVDPANADVKKDVAVGVSPRVGTYDPMAAAVFPAEANVELAETAYGPTGVEYAGALDLAAAEAAAASEQHTTDAAFLETNKDEIIVADTDILGEFGVTGTAEVGNTVIVIED
jgi:hypothetical protein